jgi:MFS family permease
VVAPLVLPLLLWWGFGKVEPLDRRTDPPPQAGGKTINRMLVLLWIARSLVQLAASFVLFYLFLYLTELVAREPLWAGRNPSSVVAMLSLYAAIAAVSGALASGSLSYRTRARRPLLVGAALLLAAALFVLASAPSPLALATAFALFQFGLAAYLAVDTAWVAQLVAPHPRRGTILGVMNLTNTLPSVLAPLLTLQALTNSNAMALFEGAFHLCAIAALTAAGLAALIHSRTDNGATGGRHRFDRPQ